MFFLSICLRTIFALKSNWADLTTRASHEGTVGVALVMSRLGCARHSDLLIAIETAIRRVGADLFSDAGRLGTLGWLIV